MNRNKQITDFLSGHVTPGRLKQFITVLENRTNYLTVVLENLYQPHNASAILRTCECYGIQNVHVIENNNTFKPVSSIDVGSSKWINISKYNRTGNNTAEALLTLKKEGYRIAATVPSKKSVDYRELNLAEGKVALLFGTELDGLSQTAIKMSDLLINVPMFGFTKSFNVSVCVSVIVSRLTEMMRNSDIKWKLTDDEKDRILSEWLQISVKASKEILKRKLGNCFSSGKYVPNPKTVKK